MRKEIKTCIYVVTAILPIILSACSNKTDNNTPKSTKESATTTFAEDTSSDITDIIEKITTAETTTEKDTTELISEIEQDTSEDVTKQQQTQANIQQTTIVTSVNSTHVPVQTTPTETTTPKPTETTTPIEELYKIKDVVGLGEKYSYNGIEFKISNLTFYSDDHSYCSLDVYDIDKIILDESESYYNFKLYFKYEVYDADGFCVKTDFCELNNDYDYERNNLVSIDISDLPSTGYTIKLSNYQ